MSIEQRADFDYIRYSNCWEDDEVLRAGLETVEGGSYLSITSAGDNGLSLLLHDPARVLSIDLNPAQTALAELKKNAFRIGSHEEMLTFLGFEEERPERRTEMYRSIAEHLSADAQHYWNNRLDAIEAGVIHLGKFERYFRIFRRRVLPLVHRRRRVESLLEPRDLEGREQFYHERWDTLAWRAMFRVFFSRAVMGRLGRDPAFFRHVDVPVSQRILERTRYALTQLDVAGNPYVRYILTGSFGSTRPTFTRRENFETIRGNLGALETKTTGLAELSIEEKFDGMNLSDIFEYMTLEEVAQQTRHLADLLRTDGRIVYWEMLADRNIATIAPDCFVRLDRLSDRLHAQDRAFFYQRCHVMRRR